MNIPVFHDDQHGTAIIVLAGLINACELTNKKKEDVKLVINGAGSAGQACMQLIYDYGFNRDNCIMCDTRGVIYNGREKGMNPYKVRYQTNRTDMKSLEDAFTGADIVIGLSQAN